MQADRVRPAWALCIDRGDVLGLRALVTVPGFDFQQSASFHSLGFAQTLPYYRENRLTPIGYSLWKRALWALELLLDAGANPDAEHLSWHKNKSGTMHYRPIELCVTDVQPREFLDCLLQHGASTHFVKRSTKKPFIDDVYESTAILSRNKDRTRAVLAAHSREVRAYTVVWCANRAGGCWPDVAMLLQAMVMREDLNCDGTSPKKQRI